MAPCTHPGMKRPFCLKAKNGLIMKRPFCLEAKNGLITSREVNEARRPHTCVAGRVRSKKKKNRQKKKARINPAAPKTHHEIHSIPATATTSIRRATKHVPRVNPYSPASIDPGFVEIGLAQLSQSSKNDECYTYTQTDGQTN